MATRKVQKRQARRASATGATPRKASPREVFRLSRSPSHLLRRAEQFATELFARSELHDGVTLRQTVLLAAIAEAEGASQSDLVRTTGVDRSTLAEMVRRMLEKGLLSRERTEEDQRANAVAISPAGRKALRGARNAADRAERALLEALPMPDRQKFVKALSQIAQAAEQLDGEGNPRPRRNLRRRKIGG